MASLDARAERSVAPAHGEHGRLTELAHLLSFGEAARLPAGGFGWLDDTGRPDPARPRMLYVTCRMTYVYAVAVILGIPSAAPLVDHGLDALTGPFADPIHGGWFTSLQADANLPASASKWAYPHAFVVLAAAAAVAAGRPGSENLLESALTTLQNRFWEEEHGMLADEYDRGFTRPSNRRGLNAVMHGVEALLAATDVTGEQKWATMAVRMADRAITEAKRHHWRLPEHYDQKWRPRLDLHRDQPADPFRPYGATPGHSLEWARLLLHIESASENREDLVEAATQLFNTAMTDAWAIDGNPGLIYTVNWDGTPMIRQRLHWVLCEALGAATALHKRTNNPTYQHWTNQLWTYTDRHILDRQHGSWTHELNPHLQPAATIRPGKADLYHATQACLLPSLPLHQSIIGALTATCAS